MTVAEFLVALIAIFVSAKVFGEFAERVHQPAVLGELIGGIVIGVSDPASTRIDAEDRGLPDLVRASPHYYNTEAEVDRLVALCQAVARKS